MELDMISVSIPTRPNCWSFDLSSAASSGYCSAANSTETEYPPFDWESVVDRLEELENLQVTLHKEKAKNYALNDCFFSVQLHSSQTSPNFRKHFDSMEAFVIGPSGYRSEVSQSPGKASNTVVCTFRPYECGPHTCHVQMLRAPCETPDPLIIFIDRQYGTEKPITTLDVEISEKNMGKIEMRKPWGVCSNMKTEQIYVADREMHEVLIFNPDGTFDSKFGQKGEKEGDFFRPTAIAFDNTRERVLVADKDNHRIQIFTPSGKFLHSFGKRGSYPGQFFFPWGIAVSRDGKHIAVADSRNHRIQLFDHQGKFLCKYTAYHKKSNMHKKEFDYPRGVCFDHAGENLYVTDFNLHSLFKLPIDLTSCERILTADYLRRPQGISMNDAGNLLLCDSRNNSIKVISTSGEILQEFKKLGKTAEIELPLDIEVMPGGYIALLDMNGRVRIF